MPFRCGLFVAFLFLFPLAAMRPAAAQLTEERSPGLRVIYLDGTESYLVPHATRTALNSLAFQKKLFGFEPNEDVTVLLLDLSDSGNAGASSVPGDLVSVQIAPLGFTFETHRRQRAHEYDHEPRAGPRRHHGSGGEVRPDVPAAVRRQGVAGSPSNPNRFSISISRRRAWRRRAGFTKASRCSSTPGWPAASAARRAATTRWCSARWSATTRRSTIRSGSSPRAPTSISRSRSIPISTARGS